MKKIVIGVTGTHASGKDTVAEYICNRLRTRNYSTSDEIGYELTARGMDHSRLNKVIVGNELREKFGTGVLARRALDRAVGSVAVVTAIRNTGEIEYLREHSCFFLIAVDASAELRFERMQKRERFGDGKTFADFKAGEDRELNAGVSGQQLVPCMRLADFLIINDLSLEELQGKAEDILDAIIDKLK